MTTVLLDGRRLPHIDFEGDDVPAGRPWVTCTDASAGRALYYSSNGRLDYDGKAIRAAIHPHDPNGIRLVQAKQAIESLTSTTIVIPRWGWTEALLHLKAKKGLIIQGWYSEIPARYRYQDDPSSFGHAVWASHYSPTGAGGKAAIRVWDALDANEAHHGQWIPVRYVRAFAEELARRERGSVAALFVGYIPLQHL